MPDQTLDFRFARPPSADRPLQGQTVLVVEDSRFASEALRLLCLRSGARIRRADSLRAAARHLAAYLPTVAVVDLGLPDGSGLELLERMAAMSPRVPVILATSAHDDLQDEALAAGAGGFLPKPISSLALFQKAILEHLPPELRPRGPRALPGDTISPDDLALADDLSLVAERLRQADTPEGLSYIASFLSGIAKTAGDPVLDTAARRLADLGRSPTHDAEGIADVGAMVAQRLPRRRAI